MSRIFCLAWAQKLETHPTSPVEGGCDSLTFLHLSTDAVEKQLKTGAETSLCSFLKEFFSMSIRYDLSTLRILGTVGEPINPEAWHWYHEAVGQGRCPVVDTFWQTETVRAARLRRLIFRSPSPHTSSAMQCWEYFFAQIQLLPGTGPDARSECRWC